ncbi:hypothetical protein D5S17_12935 [Pseudonocardiaceae bacterium YIM PH 21723]|nr:hypothetical protein D5S17_12935 [Pseudonocardiaceae bacterium YIM PH 21723]
MIRSMALALTAVLAGTLVSAPIATAAPAGDYRLFAEHAWWSATWQTKDKTFVWVAEQQLDMWIPPKESDDWLWRRKLTGNRKWLVGTEEEAKAAGVDVEGGWPTGEWRAAYGDWWAKENGREPAPQTGSWQWPTQEFQASLPQDVDGLYARLREDTKDRGETPDLEMLVYVNDALRSGQVGPQLTAKLFQVLDRVAGVSKVPGVANADGRKGTAYTASGQNHRQQIIIDPATGEFLGDRIVNSDGTETTLTGIVTKSGVDIGER